jgi:hypothetical protein
MNANTLVNPEYALNYKKYQLVRDCINDMVKQRACRGASCVYEHQQNINQGYIVRAPDISDESYYAFANRAVFKNYVGNTLDILCGAAMMRPYKLTGESLDDQEQDLPESIAYITETFTRSGNSYYDSLKEKLREVCSVGRYGVWVDYPGSADGKTAADIRQNKLYSRAQAFKAENIKDWSEKIINGRKQLNYVKLEECRTEIDFSSGSPNRVEFNVCYELYLDKDGYYSVKLDDGTNEIIYQPTLGNGKKLDFIPFQFYGSIDNTPSVDPLPLYKIAEINIALFNSDATMRQTTWLFGSPTATFSLNEGVSPQEFMQINGIAEGGSPVFGGSAYVGCEIGLAQVSVDSMLLETMDKDVDSMAQIGAQIITVGQNETAESVRVRKGLSLASLSGIVNNIESGDKNVIKWMMMFNNQSGEADEFILELNKKFYDDKIDAQSLQQLFQGHFQGVYPSEYLFRILKDNNLTIESDTAMDYKERLGNEMPSANMNLDE